MVFQRYCLQERVNSVIIYHMNYEIIWIIGWFFTIGYLDLSFMKGALAIIIWPYYLGVKFNKLKN